MVIESNLCREEQSNWKCNNEKWVSRVLCFSVSKFRGSILHTVHIPIFRGMCGVLFSEACHQWVQRIMGRFSNHLFGSCSNNGFHYWWSKRKLLSWIKQESSKPVLMFSERNKYQWKIWIKDEKEIWNIWLQKYSAELYIRMITILWFFGCL